MGVPGDGSTPSTYYYKSRDKTGKEREDANLRDRIERLALRFRRYGYRHMTARLKRDGLNVNHKRVLRIMRASDLLCRVKRKFVRTTDSNHDYRIYPNLYRSRVPDGPNQVWVADITYTGLLQEHGFQISMSRRGNPYDNAQAESFFKTLKCEEVYLTEFRLMK